MEAEEARPSALYPRSVLPKRIVTDVPVSQVNVAWACREMLG